jgi:hypothetical protein
MIEQIRLDAGEIQQVLKSGTDRRFLLTRDSTVPERRRSWGEFPTR